MHSVAEHLGDRTVRVLDPASYGEFVRMPQYIEARAGNGLDPLLRPAPYLAPGRPWWDVDRRDGDDECAHAQARRQPVSRSSRPEDPFLLSSWFLHAGPPIRSSWPCETCSTTTGVTTDLGRVLPAALHVRERRDGGPTTTPDVDGRSGPRFEPPHRLGGARLGVRRARPARRSSPPHGCTS